jgi:hypothetical protein
MFIAFTDILFTGRQAFHVKKVKAEELEKRTWQSSWVLKVDHLSIPSD